MTKINQFWTNKTLEDFSDSEWEQLCDGCGLCCLVRVQDEDTEQIYETNVVCTHYDCGSKQCSSYGSRVTLDDGCTKLTPNDVRAFDWLPDSCAYRVVMRGDPLPESHPLICGDRGQTENIVDIFEPMGLIKNGPDVEPENHLIASVDITHLQ